MTRCILNIALIADNNLDLVVRSLVGFRKYSAPQNFCISVVGNGGTADFNLLSSLKKDGFIQHLRLLNTHVCAAAAANIAWSLTDAPLYLWLPAGFHPYHISWLDSLLRYWKGGLPVSTMNGIHINLPSPWPPRAENKVLLKLPQGISGQAIFVPDDVVRTLGLWNEDYEYDTYAQQDFALRMDCARFPRYAYPLGALFTDHDLQPVESKEDKRLLHLNARLYDLCIRSWRTHLPHKLTESVNDDLLRTHYSEVSTRTRRLLEECFPVFISSEETGLRCKDVDDDSILLWKKRFADEDQHCLQITEESSHGYTHPASYHTSTAGSDRFRLIHNALVMPFEGSMDTFKAGVFENGSCITDSLLYRGSPSLPEEIRAEIPNICIFGGYMFAHYGHFLLESLSRYYAIAQCAKLPLLFLSPNSGLRLWQRQVLKILGIDNEILFIKVPTQVRELLISPQACDARTPMTEEQFAALGRIPDLPPVKGKRVWLSRSTLKTGGRIEEEQLLEAYLQTHGWEIIHPEKLPVLHQARLFMTAEHIACFDDSALYTALLCRKLHNNFIIFSRRNFFVPSMLEYIRKKGATLTSYTPLATPTTGSGAAQNWSIDIDEVISLLHSTVI